jgi:hypothetical protein
MRAATELTMEPAGGRILPFPEDIYEKAVVAKENIATTKTTLPMFAIPDNSHWWMVKDWTFTCEHWLCCAYGCFRE